MGVCVCVSDVGTLKDSCNGSLVSHKESYFLHLHQRGTTGGLARIWVDPLKRA